MAPDPRHEGIFLRERLEGPSTPDSDRPLAGAQQGGDPRGGETREKA